MQYFNISSDPYEKSPLEKEGDNGYKQLFMNLTEHIRLAGAVPWEKKEK